MYEKLIKYIYVYTGKNLCDMCRDDVCRQDGVISGWNMVYIRGYVDRRGDVLYAFGCSVQVVYPYRRRRWRTV